MPKADIIIIGGGPGGYETAAEAAALGKKVVLFERDRLGGTCLNRGCIPTKCLCASAKRLNEIRTASELGVIAAEPAVDFSAVKKRMTEVTDTLREGIGNILEKVDVVYAEASVSGMNEVTAAGETYSAPTIIIATGSSPATLRVPGAETTMNSDAVLALDTIPESMVIIGGGVIGLEFASVFNSFGCKVSVLEYCKEILPGFDRDIAKRLRSYLSRKGIEIVTGAEVIAVEDGTQVTYLHKGKEKSIAGDCVVSAVGRCPLVPDGLDKAGIETDRRGFIVTDDNYRTTADGFYAIGDVNGRCMLAHAASAQGRVVLGKDVDFGVMPAVVFTDPECAMTGLTPDNIEDGAESYLSVKIPYGANGKALASGESDGLLKLVVDRNTRKIAGCHCVGAHAADIIAEAGTAMVAGMTVDDVAFREIHAHPTLSELLSVAAATAAGQLS